WRCSGGSFGFGVFRGGGRVPRNRRFQDFSNSTFASKGAVLSVGRSLPVHPEQRTSSAGFSWSGSCHLRTSMGAAVVASAREVTVPDERAVLSAVGRYAP